MGRTRKLLRTAKKLLSAQRTVQEELELAGMGAAGWAALVAQMAQGFRPALQSDEDMALSDAPRKYKPKIFTHPDGRRLVAIDERSQFKALQLVAEVHRWRSSGVNVNVNTGAGGSAGGSVRNIDDALVLVDGSGDQELIAAVRALPSDVRRKLLTTMIVKCRDAIQDPIDVEAKAKEIENETTER